MFKKGKLGARLIFFCYVMIFTFLSIIPFFLLALSSLIDWDEKIFHFSFLSYKKFIEEKVVILNIFRTLAYSLIATSIAVLISYPVAYFLTFISPRVNFNKNVVFLISFPIWINTVVRIISLEIFLGKINEQILIGSVWGVIISMVYLFFPYVTISIYNGMEGIDNVIIEASKDLGATGWTTFWRIVFPLSFWSAVAGVLMMLSGCMSTLLINRYIAQNKIPLIADVITGHFYYGSTFGVGSAISLVLWISVSLAIFLVFKKRKRR